MTLLKTSFGMIREWEPHDLEALVKHANNRNIAINLRDGFHHPYARSDAAAFLQAVRSQDPVTKLAIATPDEAIGSIGISINKDVHRLTAEMGYWLSEAYWGRGIMSEAVKLFTEYAFANLGLVRIYAEPYAENLASCKVLEKAGFELEGRMRCSVVKEGRILDQLLYAKIRKPEA